MARDNLKDSVLSNNVTSLKPDPYKTIDFHFFFEALGE